jgi:hypothetical protein
MTRFLETFYNSVHGSYSTQIRSQTDKPVSGLGLGSAVMKQTFNFAEAPVVRSSKGAPSSRQFMFEAAPPAEDSSSGMP